jgi:hypothetical protein
MAAEHAAHRADHESLVSFNKLLERAVIAGADQSHEPNIFGVLRSAARRAGFMAGHGE